MRIAEGAYLVGRGTWGGHEPLSGEGDCNIYLIDGGSELALVDVGIGPNFAEVWQNVNKAGLDPKRLSTVLMTHTHWDHAGALPELRTRSKAGVCAHPYSAQAVKELHPHLGAGPAVRKLGATQAPRLFPIDHAVAAGARVHAGALTSRVLELPCHTPDCLGWLMTVGGKRLLFSGDAAIGDQGRTKGCIGWLDVHWGSDLSAFARTLARLCRRRIDVLCPGHGLPIVGQAKVARSLRHCRERLHRFRRFPQLGSMTPLQPQTNCGRPPPT